MKISCILIYFDYEMTSGRDNKEREIERGENEERRE